MIEPLESRMHLFGAIGRTSPEEIIDSVPSMSLRVVETAGAPAGVGADVPVALGWNRPAITDWDVVPYQAIGQPGNESINLGVVAWHVNGHDGPGGTGIDRVEYQSRYTLPNDQWSEWGSWGLNTLDQPTRRPR